ncbi:precorrin-3B C(17)-methyltransferase [uncultured Tessaracoccus sp.]|uniref:precorrin-3B C(17)-methyltransferase n=1 Tax=uncultured Tessaracoccus sp. TaxID=905023 RepID=UPI002600CB3B|nr:precorrin-3B C(17)-methyltransferase [uncultured Tessaracoccus sp.]
MIHVHGYSGSFDDETRALAGEVALVMGGHRHLDALGVDPDRRVRLGAITPALERLRELPEGADALVVASGDPGFHGVLRRIRLEGWPVTVRPAPTSVSLAFAAVGLPWEDAVVVSAHGQPLDPVLAAARRHRKVAALTSAEHTVATIASRLAGLGRTYVVAERLGEDDERVRVLTEDEARATTDVREPNVVLILDGHPDDPALIDRAHPEPRPDVIAQVTNSPAARRRADEIDRALGIESLRLDGPAAEQLPRAWREASLIISHLALGATTRIIAPLLTDKRTDPGVVVVDEAGHFAVPLVGGHAGGANALAGRLADAIGATAVLTTATDALDIPALDTLGWTYAGDVAGVTRALIDGAPVLVERTEPWPLPPMPANVSEAAEAPVARIVVTDHVAAPPSDLPTVVLHPGSLVVGMGCNKGTDVEQLRQLLEDTLDAHGLALDSVTAITTVDLKAGEPGLLKLVHQLGVPLVDHPADELRDLDVPTPSAQVEGHVGTPSVAEASVVRQGATIVVPKQRSTDATCAVGRLPARGKLTVVGLGPGSRDLLTPRALDALRRATQVVGYAPYVRQIRDVLRPGTTVKATKMGTENERIRAAIDAARAGESVAMVCGGDPAIYAMASPILELGTDGIDVEVVPGVTASLAVSAILGAPLGHDHATISLSDLHTSWETILTRVEAAARGDLVVAFYNPRSRKRLHHLPDALEILARHRPPTTPVAVVQQAARQREKVIMSTLAEFRPEWVDMNSLVVVGSSTTRYVTTGSGERRMVTPRDYQWMQEDQA